LGTNQSILRRRKPSSTHRDVWADGDDDVILDVDVGLLREVHIDNLLALDSVAQRGREALSSTKEHLPQHDGDPSQVCQHMQLPTQAEDGSWPRWQVGDVGGTRVTFFMVSHIYRAL
jgi:hypothetical protein